jgi:hypothetical protein
MKRLRVYVDTSVLGGCFDPEFSEWSNALMDDFRMGYFIPILSDILAAEIKPAPARVQDIWEELLELGDRVATTPEVEALIEHYLARRILNPRFTGDLNHVALATVAGSDVLVTWNFKHIVKFDKIQLFNAANLEMGYRELRIHTPREVTTYGGEADDRHDGLDS